MISIPLHSTTNSYHLGNNDEVVDAKGVVQQVTNYYPFGAPYADATASKGADVQPYKYNGKEFDNMHGLNTHDYGARQYNPVTGRWDRMDPHCEDYKDVSPFVYCHNSPINRVDLDGNDDYFSNRGIFLYTKGSGSNIYIQQGKGFSNFSNFDLRNSSNRQMAANVVGHYAREVGADRNYNGKIGTIGVSTLHSTDKSGSGVLAGTTEGNIFVKFSNGFFHKELYNKYNLMGVFIHEKEHKKDQQAGRYPKNKPVSVSRHSRIVINEMSTDNFLQCSEKYQAGQMGYLGNLAESVLATDSNDANKIAEEANRVLAKIGWEMYYQDGNAYFRKVK